MDRVTRLPLAIASTICLAVTLTPGATLTHVKLVPLLNSVTRQNAGGNLGWWIRTRLPSCNGGGGRSATRETLAVHSGHRSTSTTTDHTSAGGAGISTVIMNIRVIDPIPYLERTSANLVLRRQEAMGRKTYSAVTATPSLTPAIRPLSAPPSALTFVVRNGS
jgi:hypothetical protein